MSTRGRPVRFLFSGQSGPLLWLERNDNGDPRLVIGLSNECDPEHGVERAMRRFLSSEEEVRIDLEVDLIRDLPELTEGDDEEIVAVRRKVRLMLLELAARLDY